MLLASPRLAATNYAFCSIQSENAKFVEHTKRDVTKTFDDLYR